MKTQTFTDANFEDLAAEAIRLGCELAGTARQLHLGGTATDVAFVGRCLSKLAARRPFGHELDGGLEAVGKILERDLSGEILGFEERCHEVGFGEDGPRYLFEEQPVYSERGAELLKLRALYLRFQMIRGAVLDRLSAQQVLLELLGR